MDTKTIIDNIEAKAMSFEAKAMRAIHYVSGFFSLLLTPMLMPTYGMITALWMSNLLILTLQTKMTVMLVVFAITCLVPALLFLLLKKLKVISELGINDRRERLVPYIIMIVCYVAAAVYLFMINAPEWLWMFMFGGGCAALVSMIVNFKWKISAHMAGIGGLVALLCRINADGDGAFDLLPIICVAIFVGGILGTSRVAMERHTVMQVLAGAINGFLCVYYL
ncbi:MAG: hypothetical protein ACI31A_04650 [Candidatus Limisoma sp.]